MNNRAVCPEGVTRGGEKDFESDSATVHTWSCLLASLAVEFPGGTDEFPLGCGCGNSKG